MHVKTKNLVSAHFVGSMHMILKIVYFKTDEMLLKIEVKKKWNVLERAVSSAPSRLTQKPLTQKLKKKKEEKKILSSSGAISWIKEAISSSHEFVWCEK